MPVNDDGLYLKCVHCGNNSFINGITAYRVVNRTDMEYVYVCAKCGKFTKVIKRMENTSKISLDSYCEVQPKEE